MVPGMGLLSRWLGRAAGAVGWTASVASWVGVSVSVLVAAIFGAWAWATQWGYLPVALTALGTFTASIWTYRGIFSPARGVSSTGRVPTSCKIVFAPDGQPTAVAVQNIKRWFSLHNTLIAVNKETGVEERFGTTNLFITFEDAVAIKQVHVRAQGAPVPRWELKDRDPWQIVLSFNAILSGLLLEIEIEV